MDNKERTRLVEHMTAKMSELVNELVDEVLDEDNKPAQPEPQAGDVWETAIGYIYIYTKKENGKDTLRYKYGSNSPGRNVVEGAYTLKRALSKSNDPTRIFSISEHLKNKDDK